MLARKGIAPTAVSCAAALIFSVPAPSVASDASPGPPPAPGPSPDGALNVVEYNICGAMCEEEWRGRNRPGPDEVGHVRDVIVDAGAHLVVLNEICHSQLERLQPLLAESGHPMQGAFHPQRTDDRCPTGGPEGDGFGDAILSTGPVEEAEVHLFPGEGERRGVLCLPTTVGARLTVCAVHLETGDGNQEQFDDVVGEMRRRLTSETVVLAGDFNREPDQMRPLTDPAAGGPFADVDAEQNRATHYKRRIDYILLDRRAFPSYQAEVHETPWSDHRVLVARTQQPTP